MVGVPADVIRHHHEIARRTVAVFDIVGEQRFRNETEAPERRLRTGLIGRHVRHQLAQAETAREVEYLRSEAAAETPRAIARTDVDPNFADTARPWRAITVYGRIADDGPSGSNASSVVDRPACVFWIQSSTTAGSVMSTRRNSRSSCGSAARKREHCVAVGRRHQPELHGLAVGQVDRAGIGLVVTSLGMVEAH